MVDIWSWAKLQSNPDWYEKIVKPAVEQHRTKYYEKIAESAVARQAISSAAKAVTCTQLPGSGHKPSDYIWHSPYHASVRPSLDDGFSGGSNDDFDPDNGYDSDSSYERVCEENGADDIIKMLEDL